MPTQPTTPTTHRDLHSRAFTLIELIVTLVVIAALIAVAAVSYNSVIGHSKDTATGVQLTQLYKTAAGVAAMNREPLTLAHFENASAEVTLAAGSLEAPPLAAGHFEVLDASTPVTHVGQVQVAITTSDTGGQVTGLAALSRDGHCVLVRGESMGTRISARNGDCTDDAAEEAQTLTAGDSTLPAPAPTQTAPATLAGSLYGVGSNNYGQVGDGATTNRTSYTQVATTGDLAGKAITQVAAGNSYTCALASDNTIACWGSNSTGQLGDGTVTDHAVPTAINPGALAGKTIARIAGGSGHVCALTSDGVLACWGANGDGQLGDGGTGNKTTPTAVTLGALAGKTVTQVTAGGSHTCALTSDALLSCWGRNSYGEVGDGTISLNRTTPTVVTLGDLSGKVVAEVVAGGTHTCVLATDATIACWGRNTYGQLGNGSVNDKAVPTAVFPNTDVTGKAQQLTAGTDHTCALTTDSAIFCWGRNQLGELGTGDNANRSFPTPVTPGALAGKVVSQLTAGAEHVCTLTADRLVVCWGWNAFGELGDGTKLQRNVPVLASTLTAALSGKTPFSVTAGSSPYGTFVLAN